MTRQRSRRYHGRSSLLAHCRSCCCWISALGLHPRNRPRSRKAIRQARNLPARSSRRAASARPARSNIPTGARSASRLLERTWCAGHRSAGTFETGQSAVRIDLIEREGDKAARLQLFLPVGLYLQAGVKITIDQGATHRIPYVWCLTNTCIAADVADPKLIKEMETGQKLLLEVVDSSVLTVSTSLPLNQFAAARQGSSDADVRAGHR